MHLCSCGHDTCFAPIPSFGGAEMTNLITHHVEEFQQVRGQRRKLTKALIVISTLKPMSDDSWNLPLIVLEALKDILFDFHEARTGCQAWRPMGKIRLSGKQCLRVCPRILTGYCLRGHQFYWLHKPHLPFSGRYPPLMCVSYFWMGANGYWWRLG